MAKIDFNLDFIFLPLEFGYSLFSLKLKIKKIKEITFWIKIESNKTIGIEDLSIGK
jgi:hypothetical protein